MASSYQDNGGSSFQDSDPLQYLFVVCSGGPLVPHQTQHVFFCITQRRRALIHDISKRDAQNMLELQQNQTIEQNMTWVQSREMTEIKVASSNLSEHLRMDVGQLGEK